MEAHDTHFTLEEAHALVPWLQETFDAIETLKAELARAKSRSQELVTPHAVQRGSPG